MQVPGLLVVGHGVEGQAVGVDLDQFLSVVHVNNTDPALDGLNGLEIEPQKGSDFLGEGPDRGPANCFDLVPVDGLLLCDQDRGATHDLRRCRLFGDLCDRCHVFPP